MLLGVAIGQLGWRHFSKYLLPAVPEHGGRGPSILSCDLDALLVGREIRIGMSSTNTYIVPLAMLAIALMVIVAALWL